MLAEVGRVDLFLYALTAVCGVILSLSLKRRHRNKKTKKAVTIAGVHPESIDAGGGKGLNRHSNTPTRTNDNGPAGASKAQTDLPETK